MLFDVVDSGMQHCRLWLFTSVALAEVLQRSVAIWHVLCWYIECFLTSCCCDSVKLHVLLATILLGSKSNVVLNVLAGLHPVAPYFSQLLAEEVAASLKDVSKLHLLLSVSQSFLYNIVRKGAASCWTLDGYRLAPVTQARPAITGRTELYDGLSSCGPNLITLCWSPDSSCRA